MNKFRKQLKRVGMEKEFTEWMQRESVAPKGFKPGDKVRMVGDSYTYTRRGSEGIVVSGMSAYHSSPKYIDIKWIKLSGQHSVPCNFDVRRKDLELL